MLSLKPESGLAARATIVKRCSDGSAAMNEDWMTAAASVRNVSADVEP